MEVRSPSPAAAFRDALRLNPVTSFAFSGEGSGREMGAVQRETGERKLSGGEASISLLVPKAYDAGRDGMEDQGSFVVGDDSEHEDGIGDGVGRGLSSSVERDQPKQDGGMRRSKESSPVNVEIEESPVDPERRPSAVPPPTSDATLISQAQVEETPSTPGIGRAF